MLSSSGWEHNEQQFEMYGGLGYSMVQDVQQLRNA